MNSDHFMRSRQKTSENLLGFCICQHLVPPKMWPQALSCLSTKHWQMILRQEGKPDQSTSFAQTE